MSEPKIPKGYKQTEVGVIPEEWKVNRIDDIARCYSGGTPNTSISNYYNGNIPWITSGDLNRRIISEVPGSITKLGLDNSSAQIVKDNTLLMALYGATAGVVALTKIDAAINQAILAIISDSNSPIYLYYWLYYSKDHIVQTYTQGGQPNLSGELIKSLLLPLPPLPEQRAIAEALSDVDSLLSSLDKLIEKKRAIKQGAMQELLTGRKRLPGFSGKWEKKKLGAIMRICHGKSQENIIFENGKYPILATGGEIGRTDSYIYPGPSVLIGRKGTIDKPHYIATPFWTIDTLFYSEILEGIDAKFVYYFFLTIDWYALNEASGVPSLNASRIEKIDLHLPPLPEQTAIATILSDMDADIEALEKRRDKTKAIKQGMMQELLTGRIRLV